MERSPVQYPHDDASLVGGAFGSVLLHALLLSPMFVALPASSPAPLPRQSETKLHLVAPPPPDESPPLGIDKPMPPSETWIGHEQYEEHLAPPAEVEQAAMTDDPIGLPIDPRPTNVAAPADIDVAQPPSAARPPEAAESSTEVEDEPADAVESTGPPPMELTNVLESLSLPSVQDRPDVAAKPSDVAGSPDAEEMSELLERMLAAMKMSEQDKPTLEHAKEHGETGPEADAPPDTTESPPQPPPSPSPPAPPPAPTPADQADRDADPSSTIDVPAENWKLGRPLAAQGLELRPQRPSFTILTLLTAAPCNPLCEIVFRRDGRPISARMIETSCDPRIDEAVLSSLYRWRASGQVLRDLQDEGTHAVRLRILLTRRPR
jgi:hypothetical protein